jgi:hypothetical protein
LQLDGKNRAMLRSTLQTGSFAKIAHWAIFKRSALAGTGTLTRFSFSAPASLPTGRQAFAQQRLQPLLPGR